MRRSLSSLFEKPDDIFGDSDVIYRYSIFNFRNIMRKFIFFNAELARLTKDPRVTQTNGPESDQNGQNLSHSHEP